MAHNRLPRSVDTAIVGAGQAGLAMSWYLSRAGREHVVLDRRELLGGSWRDRWDNFCLATPNWTSSLGRRRRCPLPAASMGLIDPAELEPVTA
jgi:putative flavoprotein involved in K+ transport